MDFMNDVLFFKEPPAKWENYLPLGNGRLGAMVKAHPCNEIIQLNEESIWSGGPQNRLNPDSKKYLEKIRELVKKGNVLDAQELGFRTLSGTSFNDRVYQTAGDFHIDFYESQNYGIECGFPLQHKEKKIYLETYSSKLFLNDACTIVTYRDENNVEYCRKTWISAVDDMLFMHVTASEKGKINFRGYLDRGIWVDKISAEDNLIFLEDSHGIPFCAGAGVAAEGGKVSTQGVCLTGENCDEALFFLDIRTWNWNKKITDFDSYQKSIKKNTWKKQCKNNLQNIQRLITQYGVKVAAEDFFGWHLNEYHAYWDRFTLQIGNNFENVSENENVSEKKSITQIPTPELLKNASESNTELVNLYANFGRYLLISGSRVPGKLPLTLQGLWNCYMDPPWGSKYTININTEMNYWPVNFVNLSECELPLFDLLERAYENGCKAAKEMYGCRGYVLHHNTDFWGDAAPQDAWLPGTYWVLGAAWLSTHIWEHYEYTLDKKCLEKYYYLIHEACRFFVDFLQPCELIAKDGNPYLVINPSLSPENSYVTKTGEVGAFTEGCEMDNMILEHLFTSCLKARSVLVNSADNKKKTEPFDKFGHLYKTEEFDSFEYVLSHLKKPEINADGSLMEWNTEVPEVEPGHRHISHLYGLFPGHTIDVDSESEEEKKLVEACKKTLAKRLSNGGGHTGWSQAWIINFWAQLRQGDEALEAIVKLLVHSTLPNLLDNHPPFQIDGNFGSLAAILRMLVQSKIKDDGTVCVKFLPALPEKKEWQSGSVKGICIKGGYKVNFTWENGKIIDYEFLPAKENVDCKQYKILVEA